MSRNEFKSSSHFAISKSGPGGSHVESAPWTWGWRTRITKNGKILRRWKNTKMFITAPLKNKVSSLLTKGQLANLSDLTDSSCMFVNTLREPRVLLSLDSCWTQGVFVHWPVRRSKIAMSDPCCSTQVKDIKSHNCHTLARASWSLTTSSASFGCMMG